MSIKSLLEQTRYLALILVAALLVLTVACLAWAIAATADVIQLLFENRKLLSIVQFVESLDGYLVVLSLLVFALVIYELFIGQLDLPHWLRITDLQGLKTLLGSLIALMLAVKFLAQFANSGDSTANLQNGIAVAVVIAALIAFDRLGTHRTPDSHE